jgi:hypothetical protein
VRRASVWAARLRLVVSRRESGQDRASDGAINKIREASCKRGMRAVLQDLLPEVQESQEAALSAGAVHWREAALG